jgi:hypothetical protein
MSSGLDLDPRNSEDGNEMLPTQPRLVKLQLKLVKLVVTCVHYKGYRGCLPGVKRPGCGVDYPPPSRTEVK